MRKIIPDNQLQEIRQRLNYLQMAVMYNCSNHPGRLPNDIARFLLMDKQGRLWFSVKPARQEFPEKELSFPAHFCFYRKNAGFYAMAEGMASVVEEKGITQGVLFVCLTPLQLTFTECKAPAEQRPLQLWWSWIKQLIGTAHSAKTVVARPMALLPEKAISRI